MLEQCFGSEGDKQFDYALFEEESNVNLNFY